MKSRSDLIRVTTLVTIAAMSANIFSGKEIDIQVLATVSVISLLILVGVVGNQIVRALEDNMTKNGGISDKQEIPKVE